MKMFKQEGPNRLKKKKEHHLPTFLKDTFQKTYLKNFNWKIHYFDLL